MAWYLTVSNGPRTALAVGPFGCSGDADAWLPAAQRVLREREPMSHFYTWATVRIKPNGGSEPVGKLNKLLGISSP